MGHGLGQAVEQFDAALRAFRGALSPDPTLVDAVFAGTDTWVDLLRYKLVPHLAGDGCLIVAVTGGTNTGKSTVFNALLGAVVSPVLPAAAATRRTVLAGNTLRTAQCLEAKLVPEFTTRPLERPGELLDNASKPNALFVYQADRLPDRLVLMDTPDVDSIEKEHWEVAQTIRAAGDVLIAVLTGEKYKDERVVTFFREAAAAGRLVFPLMNKADPRDEFAVARKQLGDFCHAAGIEGPAFVIPHDFALAENPATAVRGLDGNGDLWTQLLALDVPALKKRVLEDTIRHFAEEAGDFLDAATQTGAALRSVAEEFEARAANAAAKYDPAPGAEVGGLFHEYIQARRGPVRRWVGAASTGFVKGASAVAKTMRQAFQRRAEMGAPSERATEEAIRTAHAQAIEQIARHLAVGYIDSARNLKEPAGHLLTAAAEAVDVDRAVEAIVKETLRSESVSGEFRAHARRTLDRWWEDHAGSRRVLEALDSILALTPAAIAAPIAIYSGGVGVAEAVVFAGPVVEQFVARVVEYQFGDAMFDFLSPWKREQQEALEASLRRHLTGPLLHLLRGYLAAFEGEHMAGMRKWRQQCLNL